MPRATAEDDADGPECLICGEARDGHKRTFWGAVHVATKTETLGNSTLTTTRYRDFKRFRVFFCDTCVFRSVLRYAAPHALGWFAFAVALVVGTDYLPPSPLRWIGTVLILLLALGVAAFAAYLSVLPFFPQLHRSEHETMALGGTQWRLRKLGERDTFFTDANYQKTFAPQFAADDGSHLIPKSRGKSRKAAAPLAAITRCPACAKATPVGPTCKHCGETLP